MIAQCQYSNPEEYGWICHRHPLTSDDIAKIKENFLHVFWNIQRMTPGKAVIKLYTINPIEYIQFCCVLHCCAHIVALNGLCDTLTHILRLLHWHWSNHMMIQHWNGDVIILTKFSSLTALEVVILTTSRAVSDENLVRMTAFSFPWSYPEEHGQKSFIIKPLNQNKTHWDMCVFPGMYFICNSRIPIYWCS